MADAEDFHDAPPGDESEDDAHLEPVDTTKSVQVPAGKWVNVPKGMKVVEGVWVDDEGYLRVNGTNGYAAHTLKDCTKFRFDKGDIVFDTNGAPWCAHCYEKTEQLREAEKIRKLFRQKAGSN